MRTSLSFHFTNSFNFFFISISVECGWVPVVVVVVAVLRGKILGERETNGFFFNANST